MNFCSHCGHPVDQRIPEGDNRLRHVCPQCDTIHYQNPKVVAGCIVQHQGKILLARRAIEPRLGLWTVPAGFMENGESTEAAAARETLEETLAHVEIEGLYSLFSLPHISQVYMLFRAHMPEARFGATSESLEVALFEEHEIPWDEMAFPVVRETLKRYFQDRKTGHFPLQTGTIERPMRPRPDMPPK